jgi:MFS transporter, FHS family, L-fucose permease
MNEITSPNPFTAKVSKNRAKYLFIIGILFFVFGFVTWLGSVLIPYLKIACELNNLQSYLVAFAFYISYFILAIPSAQVLKITGYKNGMAVGLLLMAAGTLIFIPAALTRTYFLFLTGLFVQGSGLTILQTAANPYVVILGAKESAAKRISIMGVCNGVAGIIGPLILGTIILKDSDAVKNNVLKLSTGEKIIALNNLAHKVITPYVCMTIALLLFAIFIYFSGLPEMDADAEDEIVLSNNNNKKSIFQFPHLLLGVFTLFLYVGVEVISGDTIINYGASQGIALSTAKFFTSCTLAGMLIGYFVGIICIPKFFSQKKALAVSAVAGIFFSLAALATNGYVSVTFIALLGLANSLMWPSIWPLALDDLGSFTKTGSSLLIMAIGGGALLPLLYGRIADAFTPHLAYWMVIPCYLVIFYYAVKGHKIRI